MPRIVAEGLRPYRFHDVVLYGESGQVNGDCPFCGKEGKFVVNSETGLYHCFVCREGTDKGGGNPRVFVRKLHEISYDATPSNNYATLARDRRLLYPETLIDWGAAVSITDGRWLLPAYYEDGDVMSVYAYTEYKGEGHKLLPTPTLDSGIFRPMTINRRASTIYVCEGPWDAMALYEVLGRAKPSTDGKLSPTSNRESSMMADAIVVGVPGCGVVGQPMLKWIGLCSGRHVVLMFDNDHPIERNGRKIEGAGPAALRRAAGMLERISPLPRSISAVWWSPLGYDSSKPSGADVRDILSGVVS